MAKTRTAAAQDAAQVEAQPLTVEEAQAALQAATERVKALEAEGTAILARQAQLTTRDADEFFELQKELDELPGRVHFAKMGIVQAKLDLLDARVVEAKRTIAAYQPRFDEQQARVNEEVAALNTISMEMRPAQTLLRTVASDRGALNVQLGNLRAEWANRMNAANAPVIRDLRRRPRVLA